MAVVDRLEPTSGSQQEILTAQWRRVYTRLREEIGEAAYRSWLSDLLLATVTDGNIQIEVPTRFLRDWVMAHYAERIRALWFAENKTINRVEIVVGSRHAEQTARSPFSDPVSDSSASCGLVSDGSAALSLPPPGGQRNGRGIATAMINSSGNLGSGSTAYSAAANAGACTTANNLAGDEVLEGSSSASAYARVLEGGDAEKDIFASLDSRFTFENFIVGKPNELAHAAARRVAEAALSKDRQVPFNPLFLYGGVGLGKTHLMHAIAWHIRRNAPERRVIYLSAEKFMNEFVKALRYKDTMAFKEQFRSVDVLMIDDVQFISGKDSTQEEFFHTFNALVDQNRQVVISADKSPSDLDGMEERMRSRLGWGLVADIHPTTYELRLGILQSKAEQRRQEVPPKVLEFLAYKITSNVRELEGALTRITAHAQLIGRALTLENAQDVLHDVLRKNDRRIGIDEIQKKVAEHFNIRLIDMSSSRRARIVARPRQVAMYLAKYLTQRSLPEIGRMFGNRDHTTVIHAVKKIEELLATDPALAEDVELLKRMLQS